MDTFSRFLSAVFFCFIIWIIYLADSGTNSVFFGLVKALPHGDKIGHLILFGLLALGANTFFKLRRFRVGGTEMFVGTCLVIGFVTMEELSQYCIPSRTFDPFDLLANMVGIVVFSFISNTPKLRLIANK
ncbi:MAG: VanZ family protein [Proteobacteria bacterium]|nr:VanZ family protein [Pseudomonadota bacterium]